jgi:hypothetical protein
MSEGALSVLSSIQYTVRSKSVANPWRDERIAVLALMEKNQLSTLMKPLKLDDSYTKM